MAGSPPLTSHCVVLNPSSPGSRARHSGVGLGPAPALGSVGLVLPGSPRHRVPDCGPCPRGGRSEPSLLNLPVQTAAWSAAGLGFFPPFSSVN